MAHRTWHLWCSIFLILFIGVQCEKTHNSQLEKKPWYETLPADVIDYKVHVNAGKEDCYYQYVQAGATFHVAFQVILGGDLNIGFVVKQITGEHLSPYFYNNTDKWEMVAKRSDYYAMCIDNTGSRLVSKLVNLAAVVIKYDEWETFTQELQAYNLTATNITTTLATVERQIKIMSLFQMYFKHQGAMDLALAQVNQSYVQNRSIVQICVILLTFSLQVYFVRKLFEFKPMKSMKTRI